LHQFLSLTFYLILITTEAVSNVLVLIHLSLNVSFQETLQHRLISIALQLTLDCFIYEQYLINRLRLNSVPFVRRNETYSISRKNTWNRQWLFYSAVAMTPLTISHSISFQHTLTNTYTHVHTHTHTCTQTVVRAVRMGILAWFSLGVSLPFFWPAVCQTDCTPLAHMEIALNRSQLSFG
jgi:hypothetical protein